MICCDRCAATEKQKALTEFVLCKDCEARAGHSATSCNATAELKDLEGKYDFLHESFNLQRAKAVEWHDKAKVLQLTMEDEKARCGTTTKLLAAAHATMRERDASLADAKKSIDRKSDEVVWLRTSLKNIQFWAAKSEGPDYLGYLAKAALYDPDDNTA